MSDVNAQLKEKGITLPVPPARGGLYTPVVEFDDLLLDYSG